MAKQLVGPVERHIEKVVLGVVGAVLLGAVAIYLVSSPNKIEVASGMVRPGDIDQKVLEKAELVRQRLRSAQPPNETVEPLYDDFMVQIDALSHAGVPLDLPLVVPMGPPVPIIDKAAKTTQDRRLVEVIPVAKPIVIAGRSSLLIDPDGPNGGHFVQADWATVSTIFEVRKQREKQQLEYGRKLADVVLGPLELQRRMQRLDGSWSDDDWVSVSPWPASDLGTVPKVVLTEDEGELICEKKDFAKVARYYESLRGLQTQLDFMRSMMPEIRDGDPWDVPVITSRHDVLLQDMQYLFPNDPPEPPEDRYGEAEPVSTGTSFQEEATPKAMLEEAKAFLENAKKTCELDEATRAYNAALEVKQHKAASRFQKNRANQIMLDADRRLIPDIKRGICVPVGTKSTAQLAEKEKLPTQQMWVHDARPQSIQPGRTYQYRVRPILYNRLAGQPSMFSDPLMAKTVFIKGDWSEPSGPVTFEPATYYYATGSSKRDNVVTVEVYQWFEGQWVKAKPKFRPGARVFTRKRHDVPSQTTLGEVESPLITFDAGVTVVDIDHERMYRNRKRGGRGSVVLEKPSEVCSVVFVDADGHLHERFVPLDKSNPGKSFNAARVFRAPIEGR
ncbi:MAG: hypothetical protein ACE5E5_02445 [Phycisphaerae bacterium]